MVTTNLKYKQLHDNLVYCLTKDQLEIGAIYYILKDIYKEVEEQYFNQIKIEQQRELSKVED